MLPQKLRPSSTRAVLNGLSLSFESLVTIWWFACVFLTLQVLNHFYCFSHRFICAITFTIDEVIQKCRQNGLVVFGDWEKSICNNDFIILTPTFVIGSLCSLVQLWPYNDHHINISSTWWIIWLIQNTPPLWNRFQVFYQNFP